VTNYGKSFKADDVLLFEFTVGNSSVVTRQTFSYAGGINSEGTANSVGGFAPILAVFDGTFPNVGTDPVTG